MVSKRKKLIRVNDKMQKDYVYELSAPTGKNFDPDFRPELSPREMLEMGVFGGVYMRDSCLVVSTRQIVATFVL